MIGGIISPSSVMLLLAFICSEMSLNSELARVQGT